MFLALKEIGREKFRYGLIIGMVVLTAYLMFMLMGMMLGLANQNTAAINSWGTQAVALNKNANVSLGQSLIPTAGAPKLTAHQAFVGQVPVVMETTGKVKHKQSLQFVGLDKDQFIAQKKVSLTSGHKARTDTQLVLDQSMQTKGYHLGSRVQLNGGPQTFRVVGFAKDAKLNIAPIAYGSLATWRTLRGSGNQFVASGIVADRPMKKNLAQGLTTYSAKDFIAKLPGYAAQNETFAFMIGFLMVISLIIIAVFLYILTMQKLPNYAVLRAQGIPAARLVGATLAQAFLLMVSGAALALALTAVTGAVMPAGVPMLFNWPLLVGLALALVITGVLGALLPVRMIRRVNPLDALN